jgi:hypothetical protein
LFSGVRVNVRGLVRNLAVYAIALGIIWFLIRDVPLSQLARDLKLANLWMFVPAAAGSFLIWFLGETLLYSKLFSHVQTQSGFLEVLSINATQYFLQLVNFLVAGSALVLFMLRRKGVPWLAGGWPLALQWMIDLSVLALMVLLAAPFVPLSPAHQRWYYALPAFVPLALCMLFWMRGRPGSGFARWLYDRSSLSSFRAARPHHCIKLGTHLRSRSRRGGICIRHHCLPVRAWCGPLSDPVAMAPIARTGAKLFCGHL